MGYVIAFSMILCGLCVDVWQLLSKVESLTFFAGLDLEAWQCWYSIVRDFQFVGFSLLAYLVCPYIKVRLKVATFFMCLWRVIVCCVNLTGIEPTYPTIVVLSMVVLYLTWLVKTGMMETLEQGEPQEGAYIFFMPIHSVWGILKAIFVFWRGARYESVVIVQGEKLWAVNGKRFITRLVKDTNLHEREGVKVYLGRMLTIAEVSTLAQLVGKRAVPGLRDCGKLRV
jgi:hypothetical protein